MTKRSTTQKRTQVVAGGRVRAAPFLVLTGLALAGGAFGCTRGSGNVARDPVHPTASGAAPASANLGPSQEQASQAVEQTKGFENDLEPPEAKGGGPAYESDMGESKWRGSPGYFVEDPERLKKKSVAPHGTTTSEPGR